MSQLAFCFAPEDRLPGSAWIVSTLREYDRCIALLAHMYPRGRRWPPARPFDALDALQTAPRPPISKLRRAERRTRENT